MILFNLPSYSRFFAGYRDTEITLIYGFTGSGKTHLAVYYPLKYFAQPEQLGKLRAEKGVIIIISTDKSVSRKRIADFIHTDDFENHPLRQHVILSEPDTLDSQHITITRQIPNYIKNARVRPKLIVIDPLTKFYYEEIMTAWKTQVLSKSREAQGKLIEEMYILEQLARKYRCPVVITSWRKKKDIDTPIEYWWKGVYGGLSVYHDVSVAMRLESLNENPKIIRVTLVKNRHGESGVSFKLKILRDDIVEAT